MPSTLYLCIHLCDFAARALTRSAELHDCAVAVLSGAPPLERVFATNQRARSLGVKPAMSRLQAESFAVVVLPRNRQQEDDFFAGLVRCAERFSPRVEAIAWPSDESCGATLMLDVSGSERLLGDARQIATIVRHTLAEMDYEASVAVSCNAYAALLAARGISGATAIPPGREAQTLAPLPLDVLEPDEEQRATFASWGIETLGELAALPPRALVARLGQVGRHLQQQARGECDHLLVPAESPVDAALTGSMELDHPVELLEPLLFLLSQMLEEVMQRAARRALAIASVETCLVLDGSGFESFAAAPREHRRRVRPALPERDRLTLLKLIQLDLELHPPEAAVTALHIIAKPARPQTAQQGLFAAQAPEAGRMEILLARLRKLVGEGRVGSPELLDSHAPESFRVNNFEISQPSRDDASAPPMNSLAMRMVRPPRAVEVELRGDTPEAMYYEGQRLPLQSGSGPWRTSGAWWTHPAWCREEWDVVLNEPAQRCLRLAHDPAASCWYVIGIYD